MKFRVRCSERKPADPPDHRQHQRDIVLQRSAQRVSPGQHKTAAVPAVDRVTRARQRYASEIMNNRTRDKIKTILTLSVCCKDTQDIQRLQKTFQEMMNGNGQIQVKSFIETKLTLMKLIYLRIVSIQSAGTRQI